jgi:hypothetical protein
VFGILAVIEKDYNMNSQIDNMFDGIESGSLIVRSLFSHIFSAGVIPVPPVRSFRPNLIYYISRL